MNRIIRVYGTCDDWQVEFQKVDENRWRCQVPPDVTDGQYACQFYAVDEEGDIGFWCGVLYMSSGNVCLKLDDDPISVTLIHEPLSFALMEESLTVTVPAVDIDFGVLDEYITFSILKEYDHG